MFECIYSDKCYTRKTNPIRCDKCSRNTMRNYIEDFYIKAEDNPIPDKCPRLTYDGPAEQTAGYKCPVCGTYTNPYAMRNMLCSGCGYRLNVG
jgi:DNA-directed RNA polymerase subunit RPC12/RpoP